MCVMYILFILYLYTAVYNLCNICILLYITCMYIASSTKSCIHVTNYVMHLKLILWRTYFCRAPRQQCATERLYYVVHGLVPHRNPIFMAMILWHTTRAPQNRHLGVPQMSLSLLVNNSTSGTGCIDSFSMIMLCTITQQFITSHIWSWDQVIVGNRTTANLCWRILNARSTSFLEASCSLANHSYFGSFGLEIVFTNVDHVG
jgi:hypothetical protein